MCLFYSLLATVCLGSVLYTAPFRGYYWILWLTGLLVLAYSIYSLARIRHEIDVNDRRLKAGILFGVLSFAFLAPLALANGMGYCVVLCLGYFGLFVAVTTWALLD